MKTKQKQEKPSDTPLLLNKRMPTRGRVRFVLWNLFLLLGGCAALTYCSLRLTYSSINPEMWLGFWEDLWIPVMNFALIAGACCLLFALIGRAWIAFLLTALVTLGVSIANYYLVVIRADPLQFQDVTCLREALAITGTQGYELELGIRVVLSVVGSLGFTVALFFLSRWRLRWRWGRLIGVVLAASVFVGVVAVVRTPKMYQMTKHFDHVNTGTTTEMYLSRGIIYAFTYSAFEATCKPDDYSKAEVREELAKYDETDIPEARKVDIFILMRESYADLSKLDFDTEALDMSCYDSYHAFLDESVLLGSLITNGFGGNTKDAERACLTGTYRQNEWRSLTNSYVWYLRGQGYATEGAHPYHRWFYNRQNVNRYLGFERYLFRDDVFDSIVGTKKVAFDDVLLDQVWQQYQSRLAEDDGPYFNFTVTYEGHGPYNTSFDIYPEHYVRRDADTPDGYAMNNYLGCCANRDKALMTLLERFRTSERPIVLLTFGDHKATLGKDVNNYTTAAYSRYGIDVDQSTPEGFFNYYSTDYVIWMNDAAKAKLGVDGSLQSGPVISPCYLMNVLFDTLDLGKGPAYLQAMEDMMELFPVCSTKGRVSVEGELRTEVPEAYADRFHMLQSLCYYWQTEFLYEKVSKNLQ